MRPDERIERRRPGRPRVADEPLTPVTTFVPLSVHKRLTELAAQRSDKSLSGLLRDRICRVR